MGPSTPTSRRKERRLTQYISIPFTMSIISNYILLFLSLFSYVNCFSFKTSGRNPFTSSLIAKQQTVIPKHVIYLSEESPEASGDEGETTTEAKEEEKPKEDPEITALKEEISTIETTLKNLKMKYNTLTEAVEYNSEKGYLRKCAEIDNTRRSREMSSSNSREASQASSIQNFLPFYDLLEELKAKYDDDFAQGYAALSLKSIFSELDVKDFTLNVGEALNRSRGKIVASEYSNEYAKDVVIRVEKGGMELKGWVIQLADVVVSLGSEEDAIKEAEEAKKKAEEEAEKKEEEE